MIGGHHPVPVVISVAIAILASYTALQLAGRVTAASGWVRTAWLASGSVAMGVGIWSMHFVGMLAFHLPVPIAYDIPTWLLSIAIAILASLLALFIASRSQVGVPMLGAGGLLMGAGIAGMHYTGMAAVRIPGRIEYDPALVALSIVIAVVCAFTALLLALRFRNTRTRRGAAAMAASGVVMGFAIAGLHYTAMAAARFTVEPGMHVGHGSNLLATRELTAAVVIGTLLILGLALIGSLLDRRLRLREEEAAELRESRRAMTTLLGNLPGMAYRCRHDASRTVEFASDGALELTDYSPAQFGGKGAIALADLIHQQDAPVVLDQTRRAVEERRAFQLTYRLLTARGSEKWVMEQGQGVFSPEGELVASEGFITDITERKRSTELHRQLATIVESTSDAIVSTALDGTVLTWNRGAEQIYGYAADQVLGGSIAPLLPAGGVQEELELRGRIERGEALTHLDTVRVHRDGRAIDVALTLSPIRDASGKVVAISSISRDITERKRAEEESRRARDAAESANRAKSDFLASMSHELRTPLNSVIGFANVLRKNKAENLREQDLLYLERIVGSGRHLLRLINDVLDLSKIEAGKMELELTSVSLSSLLAETVAELQGTVRTGVVLHGEIPSAELLIEADPGKLKQVLINLVGNALKFTEQGSVTLTVDVDPLTRLPSRIRVQDTGIGIPSERLASIFQPFEQAESGTARRFGGTGLGLAISASLCELLGYRLDVVSTVGVGSTFIITLNPEQPPAATAVAGTDNAHRVLAPAVLPLPLETSGASYQGKPVLVIDDDPDARMLLTHHLADFGCSVVTASTGEEGLRLARQQPPELIILDLLMPGMNGWEVMHTLRTYPELRRVPVVVASSLTGVGGVGALGVVDFLPKPVEREQMAVILGRSLGRQPRRVLVVDDDENARVLISACFQEEPGLEIRTATNGREAITVLQTFAPDVLVLDLQMPELDGTGFLTKIRSELPHFKPAVVVVTAQDLGRLELQRLSEQTLAVLRKNGELEAELRQVLDELWGTKMSEEMLSGAA